MLVHPHIDPIAFSVGPLAVRWYGLMYLLGFAAGWWLGNLRIRQGLAPVTRQQFDDLIFLAVLGVILGGRLGYVLFYKPDYYFSRPSLFGARNEAVHEGRTSLSVSDVRWMRTYADDAAREFVRWIVQRGGASVADLDAEIDAGAAWLGTRSPGDP